MNQEPLYKNKDWLEYQFVQLGKECRDIALENNWTVRVVEKWCYEKYGINNNYRRDKYIPNKTQLQLIYGGLLGDGCISQRKDINFTQYIFTQNEKHKEYIEWIFDKLKNMCKHKELQYSSISKTIFKTIDGYKEYNKKPTYRISTRGYKFLKEIKNMSINKIIDNIDELGLSVYFLDDGSKKKNLWNLCMGNLNIDEVNYFINKLNEFGIKHKRIDIRKNKNTNKEYIYLYFDVNNSYKINTMIINNIPNNIDIVKKKVGDFK